MEGVEHVLSYDLYTFGNLTCTVGGGGVYRTAEEGIYLNSTKNENMILEEPVLSQ